MTDAARTPAVDGLRDDVVSGLRWVASSYYVNIVVRLAISVTLGRLLTPSEFGVMALAMAVIGGLALVQESGFSSALVQHDGHVERAAAAVWIVSIVAGVAFALALAPAAPWVAGYFAHPELATVLRLLGVILVVRAAGNAPRALLQRAMRFRATAVIETAATAVYGVVGVVLAALGHGVWSLVWGQLASEIVGTAGALWFAPLRLVQPRPDFAAVRQLGRFGRHIVAANLLGMLHLQLPALVVGKLLGADSLGLYEMALRWAWLPVQGINHVAARVSYPAFARLRDAPSALAAGYAKAFHGILFLSLPAAVGMALVADPLMRTLYGAQWMGAIAPLQILACFGLFHALAATTGEVFKAVGRPGLITIFAVLYNVVLAAMLYALGAGGGLVGVSFATLLAPLVVAVACIGMLVRLLPLRAATILGVTASALRAVTVMAVATYAARLATGELPAPLELARTVVVGAASYVAMVYVTERAWAHDVARAVGLGRFAPGAVTPTRPVGDAAA